MLFLGFPLQILFQDLDLYLKKKLCKFHTSESLKLASVQIWIQSICWWLLSKGRMRIFQSIERKDRGIKDKVGNGSKFRIRGFPGSLKVQWLRLCASTARGMGLTSGQRTQISHVVWHGQPSPRSSPRKKTTTNKSESSGRSKH